MEPYNQYLAVVAESEASAREIAGASLSSYDPMIHMEPPTEEEESPTFIFQTYNEVQGDFDDWEYLHDHYTLELPNYPIEFM